MRVSTLAEILAGPELKHFRVRRHPYCLHCPSQRHVGLGIRTSRNPPYAASAREAAGEPVQFLRLVPS